MPSCRGDARAGREVRVIDAEGRGQLECLAMDERVFVADAERAQTQDGLDGIRHLQDRVAKYDRARQGSLARAIQGEVIEAQPVTLADPHHGLKFDLEIRTIEP